MSSIYELARNLGEELLKTPEVEKFLEAKKVYEADTEIVKLMDEYVKIQKDLQMRASNGTIEAKEQQEITDDLMKRAEVIRKNPAASALFEAENAFNSLMNSVFSIVTSTMAGDEAQSGCGGSCSSDCCSSCGGGCH